MTEDSKRKIFQKNQLKRSKFLEKSPQYRQLLKDNPELADFIDDFEVYFYEAKNADRTKYQSSQTTVRFDMSNQKHSLDINSQSSPVKGLPPGEDPETALLRKEEEETTLKTDEDSLGEDFYEFLAREIHNIPHYAKRRLIKEITNLTDVQKKIHIRNYIVKRQRLKEAKETK